MKVAKTKVLFCCAHNRTRSPTGEHLLALVDGYDVKSAGLCVDQLTDQDGRVKATQELVNWANLVFVMKYWMKEYMLLRFRVKANKIKVLGVSDGYCYGEPGLVTAIVESLKRHGIDVSNVVGSFQTDRMDRQEKGT